MASAGSPGSSCCSPKMIIDTKNSVGISCSRRLPRNRSIGGQPIRFRMVAGRPFRSLIPSCMCFDLRCLPGGRIQARAVRPAGKPPRRCDGTRVPTRQPRGLAAPGGCGGLLESLAGSRGPHGPGGCLTAPAFGDLCPGPHFGFPLRPIAGASRSHLEPLKAGSGSPPLLALRRYRSARASWISSPPLGSPSRRRSLPREGRIDPRPVAGQRRADYRHGLADAGISAIMVKR